MKILVVNVLALVSIATARNVNLESVIDFEGTTAYGYLSKIGAPLAEKIRKAEEEADQNPSRIVGGEPSRLGQFPYQAGIIIDYAILQGACGGSLLNSRRVVTAGHCWFDGRNQAWRFTIVLGTIRLFSGGTRIATSNVLLHPDFWPATHNDIAMVMLPFDVHFSSTIAPIALPSGNEITNQFVGAIATTSGFGYTSDTGSITIDQYLSHVEVPVISYSECYQFFPFDSLENNICTSGAGGKNPCASDSGGPLVVTSNNRRILIGVLSFASIYGCSAGHPSAFIRVTSYLNWINQLL